jgi:outer membrane lipase/esterase
VRVQQRRAERCFLTTPRPEVRGQCVAEDTLSMIKPLEGAGAAAAPQAVRRINVSQETLMFNPIARAARPALSRGALSARAGAVALSALLLAACGGGSSDAPTPKLFSSVVVFGASLTDTGNVCPSASTPGCPPVPPYAAGRFSNGTLFIETVAARYGATVRPSTTGGNNFAYAGARTGAIPGLTTQSTTPSMIAQLDQFIQRASSAALMNPQTLFVVDASTFGNNINAGLPLIGAGTITPTQLITAGVTDVVTLMTRLYAAGARRMLVVNAPNVGLTPLVRPQGPAVADAATQIAGGFNGGLAGQITALVAASPGLTVYSLDTFSIQNAVTANPSIAGLTNALDACTSVPACVSSATVPDTYLYWDTFHPTRAFGAYIATQVATILPAP